MNDSVTSSALGKPSRRLAACLIDLVAAIAAMSLAGVMLSATGHEPGAIISLVLGLGCTLALTIVQVTLLTTAGQTIGKKAMKLRIVRASDDGNPGFVGAVLLRWIVPILITAIPYIGWVALLADSMMILRPDHRCAHDLIAGTKVICAD